MAQNISGAIDLGGTKIEARLFDAQMLTRAMQRIPTPRDDFQRFIAGLSAQIDWLEQQAGDPALPVAISIAGVIDPETGIATAANLPVSGQNIGAALLRARGRAFPLINDCMAFAWSEAHGGAATGARSALGLVLGTGIGCGLVLDGRLPHRHAGLAVEIGHLGVPARVLHRHGLPHWPCGCGRDGCFEVYVAGPGLGRIAAHTGLTTTDPAEIAALSHRDDRARWVMSIWANLAGEMLYAAQVMLDPDVIVLGGGLSNIDDLPQRLTTALKAHRLGNARLPRILRAMHGDSSGARGAALLARGDRNADRG